MRSKVSYYVDTPQSEEIVRRLYFEEAKLKMRVGRTKLFLFGWLLAAAPGALQAQFTFATNNGTITITAYTGFGGAVTIPETIDGLPVTGIGDSAFNLSTRLTQVTI